MKVQMAASLWINDNIRRKHQPRSYSQWSKWFSVQQRCQGVMVWMKLLELPYYEFIGKYHAHRKLLRNHFVQEELTHDIARGCAWLCFGVCSHKLLCGKKALLYWLCTRKYAIWVANFSAERAVRSCLRYILYATKCAKVIRRNLSSFFLMACNR